MNHKKHYCGSLICLGIVLSIIVGIAVAVLFSFNLIPVTLNFIKIALYFSVIAMGMLLSTLLISHLNDHCVITRCVCCFGNLLLAGSIGAFLSTTVAATVGLVFTSTLSIIFVGLSALFFTLTVMAVIFLVSCILNKTCDY